MLVSAIFNSPEMRNEIQATHHSIRNQILGTSLMTDGFSVMDFLADPDTSFRRFEYHDKIKRAIVKEKGTVTWTNYGFRAGPEISMLEARQNFISRLTAEDLEALKDPATHVTDIQRISLIATTSGVLLAFKYWWLCTETKETFRGLLSSTRPVKKTLKALWGLDVRDALKLSDFQHRLAHELSMDPNELNTALWIIGNRLT